MHIKQDIPAQMSNDMSGWLFAFFHLLLLLGILAYAVYSLLHGNVIRFAAIGILLAGYYFLFLHKAVKKEIKRKKTTKK